MEDDDDDRVELKEEGEAEVLSHHQRSHRRSQSSVGEGSNTQEGEASSFQVAK